MEYYLAIRKDTVLPFVTMWMDLGSVMLSEISQKEKDKQEPYDFSHVWI